MGMATKAQRKIRPVTLGDWLSGDLMELATLYGRASNLKLSVVGVRVRNDQRFFTDKVVRGAFTAATYDAAVRWFSNNWPDGVAWPDDVWRPM